MFVYSAPILTGTEPGSLYWYLSRQVSACDGETWGIALLELQDKGFNPTRIIVNNGSALCSGHEMVMPKVPCHGDIFHIIKELMELRRYFRNRLKSAITEYIEIEDRMMALQDFPWFVRISSRTCT